MTHPTRRFLPILLLSAVMLTLAALGRPAPAYASCGGTTNVANEGALNTAIAAFNAGGAGCVFTINQTADITLTANLTTINNSNAGSELIIDGNNHIIYGIIFDALDIDVAKVTADELNIESAANSIIASNGSDLTVTNSVIRDPDSNGLLVFDSTVNLTNLTITGGSGDGLEATNSTVVADSVTFSGLGDNGFDMNDGSLTLTGSTIARTDDSGVFAYGNSTVLIKDSAITGTDNDGIFITASSLTLINSTIAQNQSDGVEVSDASALIINSTSSNNDSGLAVISGGPFATTVTVHNSILADSLFSDCRSALFGTGSITITFENSLLEDTDADACGLPAANPDANGNIVGETAYLGLLGNYGGPTKTVPPLTVTGDIVATSPAIDNGDTALAVDELSAPLAFDQRGTGFPRVVNSTVDMGAFEGVYNLDCAFPLTVVNETEWNDAIHCYNMLTTPGSYAIEFGADIDLTAASTIIGNPIAGIDLTIEGNDFTIDGQDILEVRPIHVAVDTDVTINDLTITGGSMDDISPNDGGGIFNDGNLTLNRVTVVGNATQDDGGGVFNSSEGTLTIVDSSISSNIAGQLNGPGDGGGISNQGFMTITDSVVDGNAVLSFEDGNHGGGIYNLGDLVITRSSITNNSITASSDENVGAGIDTEGALTVIDSTISGNTSSALFGSNPSTGGGINFSPNAGFIDFLGIEPELIIVNSTISGNSVTAEFNAIGGAIYVEDVFDYDTVVKIINTTISDNSVAVTNGGGTALTGGAAFISKSDPPQTTLTVTIDNTIIANSITGGAAGDDCRKSAEVFFDSNSSLYEDIGANACGVVNADANGNITGSDPVLGALGNNGGPTQTHLPLAGSPAIDSGDNALALDPTNPLTADQRGFTPRIVNVIVDRGSVEVGAQSPSFCPIADPNVGTLMTDLIGTGQGSKTKGYRTRQLVVPFSSDVVALYGQLASTDIGVMKYVRFLPQGYPKVQIANPTSYAYKAYAISWWGSDLPADATWVKGQFFWGAGGNKSPRAFVLWPTYDTGTDEYANVFTTFDTSMENHVAWETGFIPTQTQTIAIPEVQADGATVVVRVAVVDNDKDNRPVLLDVSVGSQTQSNADLVPNAKDTLNLYELTFENVEAGVDEVTIYLESPVPSQLYVDGGDSAAMIGAAVSYACAPAP